MNNNTIKAIIYKTNKKAIILELLTITLVLLIFYNIAPHIPGRHHFKPTQFHIVFLTFVVAIFALYIMFPRLQMFLNGKALILDSTGLRDYTIPLGFIPWSGILNVSKTTIPSGIFRKKQIIQLNTNNPKLIIDEIGSFRSMHLKNNSENGKYLLYIDLKYIASNETVFNELSKFFESNKSHT